MKLTIKVTKEILERSKMCKGDDPQHDIHENCAIALAVRDIMPKAVVTRMHIKPFGWGQLFEIQPSIPLPVAAIDFIGKFDDAIPEERVLMPEIEFDIELPEYFIDSVNIDEIKPLLENHPTLSLA